MFQDFRMGSGGKMGSGGEMGFQDFGMGSGGEMGFIMQQILEVQQVFRILEWVLEVKWVL